MSDRDVRPSAGTLEELITQIEHLPAGAITFRLWVPEELTYEGEPITQEAAMAVVLDALLGREMVPDGHEQGIGGRMYRYHHEAAGGPGPQPQQSASRTARWLVRALRSLGIGPMPRTFRPGQVWRYATRPGEHQSRVQILRVDADPDAGEIIHVAITGVHLRRSSDDPSQTSVIGHVPVARAALEASGLSLEAQDAEVPDFKEGYDMWRAAFEEGKAGIFSVPIAEIVDVTEATLEPGAHGGW